MPKIDKVFFNGQFTVANCETSGITAVAMSNHRITHVGTAADILMMVGPETVVINLKGQWVPLEMTHNEMRFVQVLRVDTELSDDDIDLCFKAAAPANCNAISYSPAQADDQSRNRDEIPARTKSAAPLSEQGDWGEEVRKTFHAMRGFGRFCNQAFGDLK